MILCDTCFNNITNLTRVHCTECSIDQCPSCFYGGKENALHKTTHRYRVMEPMTFNVYQDDWNAIEEVLFIEGLGLYGIGNWLDMSRMSRTTFTRYIK